MEKEVLLDVETELHKTLKDRLHESVQINRRMILEMEKERHNYWCPPKMTVFMLLGSAIIWLGSTAIYEFLTEATDCGLFLVLLGVSVAKNIALLFPESVKHLSKDDDATDHS